MGKPYDKASDLYGNYGEQELTDLNRAYVPSDGSETSYLDDNSVSSSSRITVFFRNIVEPLLEQIHKSDLIVGCVAWLTHRKILEEFANVKYGVQILVQKEDFLRPDDYSERRQKFSKNPFVRQKYQHSWKTLLHNKYSRIELKVERHLLTYLSVGSSPELQAIRCVGTSTGLRPSAAPRMHHKFLVFMNEIPQEKQENVPPYEKFYARSVWTGSFNITENAEKSLENAILIEDQKIAEAYYSEWAQLLGISEPLDWKYKWVAPEWRYGT